MIIQAMEQYSHFKSSLLRNKSESSLILSLDNNYKSILEEQNELTKS